jgi:hypothetical protein
MRHSMYRIPIPLLLALAVAVGVTVTIIIQVTILAPTPAVVLPIETTESALESGTSTHTINIDTSAGYYAVYGTLAGLGKLRIQVNTTGWYYLQNDLVVTVVRRNPGDAVLSLSSGHKVYVKEINATHAFVLYDNGNTGIVAKKVQVGSTGWYVYHPTVTSYDTATRNAITSLMSSLGLSTVYVFQPKSDYVEYDPNTKTFTVYFDAVSSSGSVTPKDHHSANATSFVPVHAGSPVIADGAVRIDTYNYVLYSVWALLYFNPTSSVRSAFSVTPVS